MLYNVDSGKGDGFTGGSTRYEKGVNMAVSEAKKKANAKWDSENMATIACKLKRKQAEDFKTYCQEQGKTANTVLREYVLTCIGEDDE